jgi:hypothetical protein
MARRLGILALAWTLCAHVHIVAQTPDVIRVVRGSNRGINPCNLVKDYDRILDAGNRS